MIGGERDRYEPSLNLPYQNGSGVPNIDASEDGRSYFQIEQDLDASRPRKSGVELLLLELLVDPVHRFRKDLPSIWV